MIWVTLAGWLLATCSTQRYVPDAGEFLSDGDLRSAHLQRYWEAEIPLPAGDRVRSATLLDDSIYVVSRQGNVVAYHAGTGLGLWSYPLGDGLSEVLAPTHLIARQEPRPVAFVCGRRVVVLDRDSGELLTRVPIGFPAGAPAVGDDSVLYLGSSDGHLYAVRWHPPSRGIAGRLWRVRARGPIRSRPAYDGFDLFFASEAGDVYSAVARTRTERWSAHHFGQVFAALLLHDSGLYVASADRSLYRLDPDSGEQRWRVRLPLPLEHDPIVAGKTVFQPGPRGGLYAIGVDSGEILWHRPEAACFVARTADTVYVLAGGDGHLLALDAGSGDVRRTLAVHDAATVVPNPYGDAIYLVSDANRIACLRPADVPYLTLRELAAVRERLRRQDDTTEIGEPLPGGAATEERSPADDVLRSSTDVPPLSGR